MIVVSWFESATDLYYRKQMNETDENLMNEILQEVEV